MNYRSVMKGALLGLALTCTAQAVPVVTFTDLLGNGSSVINAVHGWEFTTNSDISVTALGFFDAEQDGLSDAHEVGIFSAAGTLLTSATVPSGTAATLTNQFRYVTITPLLLASGQTFRIGAHYPSGADRLVINATGLATDPAITKSPGRFSINSVVLVDPTNVSLVNNGSFGPNFDFVLAAGVPEVNGLSIVALGATLVLLCLAEPRRKHSAHPVPHNRATW